MTHGPYKAASAMLVLIALGACASRTESTAVKSLRQKQIDDLTQLVRDYESQVEEQHARSARGLGGQFEVRSAQIELAVVKSELARATGDRDAYIAELRESVALTEELVARQEASVRDPNMVDKSPADVFEARKTLVELRQQLIEALRSE